MRSTTASITQSASLISSKSSSRLPGLMCSRRERSTKRGGSDFLIISIAFSEIWLGLSLPLRSSKTTWRLEFAKWAAMPEPIVPAPITTIFLNLIMINKTGIITKKLT